MIRVWTCEDMISKHVPPLSGLTSLITTTGCSTVGVDNVLLLILISTYKKLRGSYLKSRKAVLIHL
jgi:hypothetical protein